MGWASHYITQLQAGHVVKFRPRGNSMTGKINSGDLCTVIPITEAITLEKGDIVLCKVSGNEYLHLISAINGTRYQISNNHGHINGFISIDKIYGKCTLVEK